MGCFFARKQFFPSYWLAQALGVNFGRYNDKKYLWKKQAAFVHDFLRSDPCNWRMISVWSVSFVKPKLSIKNVHSTKKIQFSVL